MIFLYSEKLEDIILEHNRKEKKGFETMEKLGRQLILCLLFRGRIDCRKSTEQFICCLKKINYFVRLEEWLKKNNLFNVDFSDIFAIMFHSSIEEQEGKIYSGFAQKAGEKGYVFVEHGVSLEGTMSILTHEIMHIELEPIFERYQENTESRVADAVKEEVVEFIEHYALEQIFNISMDDLDSEVKELYKFLYNMNHNNLLSAIDAWIKKSIQERGKSSGVG